MPDDDAVRPITFNASSPLPPGNKGRALFFTGNDLGDAGIINVTIMKEVLQEIRFPMQEACFLSNHPHFDLCTGPTNKANVIRHIQWLFYDAKPGDFFFIGFSCHGGQIHGKNPSQFINVCDNRLYDHELHDLVTKPLPAGAHLICFCESCHSGTLLHLPLSVEVDLDKARSHEIDDTDRKHTPGKVVPSSVGGPTRNASEVPDIIELSACQADESGIRLTSKNALRFGAGINGTASISALALAHVFRCHGNHREFTFYDVLQYMHDIIHSLNMPTTPMICSTLPITSERMFSKLDPITKTQYFVGADANHSGMKSIFAQRRQQEQNRNPAGPSHHYVGFKNTTDKLLTVGFRYTNGQKAYQQLQPGCCAEKAIPADVNVAATFISYNGKEYPELAGSFESNCFEAHHDGGDNWHMTTGPRGQHYYHTLLLKNVAGDILSIIVQFNDGSVATPQVKERLLQIRPPHAGASVTAVHVSYNGVDHAPLSPPYASNVFEAHRTAGAPGTNGGDFRIVSPPETSRNASPLLYRDLTLKNASGQLLSLVIRLDDGYREELQLKPNGNEATKSLEVLALRTVVSARVSHDHKEYEQLLPPYKGDTFVAHCESGNRWTVTSE